VGNQHSQQNFSSEKEKTKKGKIVQWRSQKIQLGASFPFPFSFFPSLSFFSLFSFPFTLSLPLPVLHSIPLPFPSLEVGPFKIQLRGLGKRCELPQRFWGGALAEIKFGAF